MRSRPIFSSKSDFMFHSRSLSFCHIFLRLKDWLASIWFQKLIYNAYLVDRSLWYRVWGNQFWLDLRVCGITKLKHLKFNQPLKQSHMTMKKVFEVSIWSIMTRIARFYFWIENFSFIFLSNRLIISRIFISLCSPVHDLYNAI
jgi:hypothetical protein